MKIKNSYIMDEKKYYFPKRKRRRKSKIKFDYKYIIYIFIFIFICWIIIISLHFLRVKKLEKYLSDSKNYYKDDLKQMKNDDFKLQSFIENKNRAEQLMKLVNNSQLYIKATKCFSNNPDKDLCFYKYLVPKKVVGKELKLIGPKHDGGYVLLNDMDNISIAYSIGIDHEISFDAALAEKNIDIYMYDHTINSLSSINPKFHWKKIGISGISNKKDFTKTLEEMLEENGHLNEKNMILKLDVEYAEWDALLDTPEDIFKKFKYITIEFHFQNETEKYFKVLKKIYKTHQVIYLLCNNYEIKFSFLNNNIICTYMEISYIIREGNEFYIDNTTYPIPELKLKNYEKLEHSFNLNIIKLFDYQNN